MAKIIVDEMLNDLSKWLRLFGIETEYIKDKKDEEIIEEIKKKKQKYKEIIFFTSDVELSLRLKKIGIKAILIENTKLEEKIATAIKKAGLEEKISLERPCCPICGKRLELLSREEAEKIKELPEKVKESHSTFYVCRECKAVFWKGSHWKRIRKMYKKVKELLDT